MSDPLQDAMPGQSPARLLRASTFNLQMEMGRWYRENRTALSRRTGAGEGRGDDIPNRLEVRVRTSSDLDQFAVIDLGEPLIDPEAAPRNAQNTPVYEAIAPAGGVFAILPAPIAEGSIGRAIVVGHAVCDLVVNNDDHRFAVPIEGDLTALESAATGPIEIIWKGSAVGSGGGVRAAVLIRGGATGTDSGAASVGCAGWGWIAGLRQTRCLRAFVAGDSETAVGLSSEDGLTWVTAEGDGLTICEVEYGVTLEKPDGCGLPCLTLTPTGSGSGGGPYSAAPECGGCGFVSFAFPLSELCPDTEEPEDVCDDVIRIRVETVLCEAWYCVADTDEDPEATCEDGPRTIVFVDDVADLDELIVCSGPYDTEEGAIFGCAVATVGGSCPATTEALELGVWYTDSVFNLGTGQSVGQFWYNPPEGDYVLETLVIGPGEPIQGRWDFNTSCGTKDFILVPGDNPITFDAGIVISNGLLLRIGGLTVHPTGLYQFAWRLVPD